MRPLTVIVALAGLGGIGWGLMQVAEPPSSSFEVPTRVQQPPVEPDAQEVPAQAPVAPQQPATRSRPPARSIAPSVIAAPQLPLDELERVEGRGALSEMALAVPPKRPEMLRLYRPVAPAAGVIEADGFTVSIAGVESLAAEESCTDAQGRQWPCGAHARTAFRSFLRGRAVECRIDPELPPGPVSSACSLGPTDLAAWLVANGWARAGDDVYREAEQTARAAGRGIHAGAPGG